MTSATTLLHPKEGANGSHPVEVATDGAASVLKAKQQQQQHGNGLSRNTNSSSHNGSSKHHFSTRLIHEGSEASTETNAVIPPISLSTTYKQDAVGVHKGFEYTRALNPNRLAFETLIASLELPDGHETPQTLSSEERTRTENLPHALAFSSGSSVTQAIITSLVSAGGHVLCVNDCYGGTYRYLTKMGPISNISTTFVEMSASLDVQDIEEYRNSVSTRVEAAFQPDTQLVWIETPTNPSLRLIDIGLISEIAHRQGAIVVVDNTFLSPYYQRPLELGADIVTHSVTKYINGFSDVLMGVLVTPRRDLLAKLRFYQNASGAVPSAFDCWLAQRGAKTLALRMQQHGTSALALARWLAKQSWVTETIYPGLEGKERDLTRRLAWKQLSSVARERLVDQGYTEEGGFPYGGMVSFRLDTSRAKPADGGEPAAAQVSSDFLSSLKVFTLAESLGGVESLAELPSLMTHASISEEDRKKAGIDDRLIRLSVGIEDVRDLEADLQAAASKVLA